MARPDTEITADIGNDGADRSAANLGGNLLGCGQAGQRVSGFGGTGGGGSGARRWAGGRCAWRRSPSVQLGGVADDPGFEGLGPKQAADDTGEHQRDIAGASWVRVVAERDGELPAVIDELANEGKEAAGAAGVWNGSGLGSGHAVT
jgi:hypothetical protein